jgi:tetratricopeptide (TPR) repeat protein
MEHLNDLPKRSNARDIETQAKTSFENLIARSKVFDIQGRDIYDNGTDYRIEVYENESATNARVDVQLKGTEAEANSDNTVSISVSRSNLNYLLVHPYSFYVCYHLPTSRLLYQMAESVFREYEHSERHWTDQATLTVRFSEPLGEKELEKLARLAKANTFLIREGRVAQSAAHPQNIPHLLRDAVPELHVPEDAKFAYDVLEKLYAAGEDRTISANFEKFAAVFGIMHRAMLTCYLSETNLAMAHRAHHLARVEAGILVMKTALESEVCHAGTILYNMGSAYSALGREEEAIEHFRRSLNAISDVAEEELRAQCLKNLGSSIEKIGRGEEAADYYREALKHDPNLAEAHNALGYYHHKAGRYQEALHHFDQVVFADNTYGKISAVVGWRLNTLFNLDDGRSAFREIFTLLNDADREPWIWNWCAHLVAIFGRKSVSNARSSVTFWERFLARHPESESARRESLLARLFLRSNGQDIGVSFETFKTEFKGEVGKIPADSVAFLWDRLGHWAQDEQNWEDAAYCFRKAYDLEGGDYGYCLGVSLNALERYEDSLPILLAQAEVHQPDAKSWFQVAAAYEHLNRVDECIEAYRKAIGLEPAYALAWFNLGGVCWNNERFEDAFLVWNTAIAKFPDHALAETLRTEEPFALFFAEKTDEDS